MAQRTQRGSRPSAYSREPVESRNTVHNNQNLSRTHGAQRARRQMVVADGESRARLGRTRIPSHRRRCLRTWFSSSERVFRFSVNAVHVYTSTKHFEGIPSVICVPGCARWVLQVQPPSCSTTQVLPLNPTTAQILPRITHHCSILPQNTLRQTIDQGDSTQAHR